MTSRRLLAWLLVLAPSPLLVLACSSESDAGGSTPGDGGYACTTAPNCSACQACFDTCLCNNGNAQGCLAQCIGTGTGGAGSGGAPGGGGAPAGGGGGGGGSPSCTKLDTGSPTCNSCVHQACCAPIDACLADTACVGLMSCLSQNCANAGSNISACAQQYCSQYASGVTAYNAISQCVQQSCAGSC